MPASQSHRFTQLPYPSLGKLWQPSIILVALIFSLPVITIFSFIFADSAQVWSHLVENLLAEYISHSVILVLGVAIGTFVIGVSSAWLTSVCNFPAKRFFSWALLLPLAMPAYIIAYTYTGLFDLSGPFQSYYRELSGLEYGEYWFPEIRSLGGAISMLSLVLYPYVYLLSRAAFLDQSVCVLEASRSLGLNPWQSFIKVALPLARPAIVAGLSLALMETLADYGTVSYFGISVFTTGIFRTWFGLGDSVAAAKLASILLLFVFSLVLLERWSRKQAKYHHSGNSYKKINEFNLTGYKAIGAFLICFIPLFLGFILPAFQLFLWALETYQYMIDDDFWVLVQNTVLLGFVSAIIALFLAIFLAYGKRMLNTKKIKISIRITAIGYAVPGTIIAIGVIIPFAWLDQSINHWANEFFDIQTGLIFSGTLFALIFAYMVRFLAVSIQAVEAGLDKIKPSIDNAASSLGYTPKKALFKVHLPIMKGTLLTAIMIVFVDVMKELPATLILRPFDFNTLAVRAFELASDERLADSSTAALMIVIVGLIPVILLSQSISRSRVGSHS